MHREKQKSGKLPQRSKALKQPTLQNAMGHFIAMLQMGHTAWSALNLLLERLDRSSASSYLFWRLTASGLEVGGRGRKGFGKGKAEGVKVLVTAVLALDSQACCSRVCRCCWWTAM